MHIHLYEVATLETRKILGLRAYKQTPLIVPTCVFTPFIILQFSFHQKKI